MKKVKKQSIKKMKSQVTKKNQILDNQLKIVKGGFIGGADGEM